MTTAIRRPRPARRRAQFDDFDEWFDPSPMMSAPTRRAARYALNLWMAQPPLRARLLEGNSINYLWTLVSPLLSAARKGVLRGECDDEDCESDDEFDDEDFGLDFTKPDSLKLSPAQRRLFLRWMDRLPSHALNRLDVLDAIDTRDAPLATIGLLQDVLNMPPTERALLEYVGVRDEVPVLRRLLRVGGDGSLRRNRLWLASAVGLPVHDVHRALSLKGTLHGLDLICEDRGSSDMEDYLRASDFLGRIVAEAPDREDAMLALLVEPLPEAKWTLADFPHLDRDAKRLVSTLSAAALRRAVGVNGLLYGPAGAGKTEFASAVCAASRLNGFRVRSADDDGDGLGRKGRISAYLLAQRLFAARDDVVIVFDEIEDVFAHEGLGALAALLGGERLAGREKGFINRTLEDNPIPALWITNAARSMDPAFLRRFLLPVALQVPPREVRRRIVEAQLGGRNLPDELLDALAADGKLMPAQFDAARRLLEFDPDLATAADRIREAVSAQRRLLHGAPVPRTRPRPLEIDIAFLNVAGGVAPGQLLAALDRRRRGSLCLYGPSGTGKTEFAHLIADALDLELVVRRASDLKSKYVGETEANLAEAFNAVDPERCVLLFDEVDSFLRDRRHAERSWEISEVNELLQQMEEFPGIFIATTNLMSQIDSAALRRFDFKLAFQPLRLEQRMSLFAREALGDGQVLVPDEFRVRLARLEGLTTGDFANVVRQQELLGDRLSPELFIARLAEEAGLRRSL